MEPCELRALLSATTIAVSIPDAAPCDATEVEVDTVSHDSAADGGAEGKITDVVDPNWDFLLASDGFVPTEFDATAVDATAGDVPPMRLMFYQAAFVDDAGIADDSVPVGKTSFDELAYTDENFVVQDFVGDENVSSEDAPPVGGWDPSWLYRSFVGSSDGEIDDAGNTDELMLEDGVPIDEVKSDNSNDGVDPVIFMTFGGVVKDSDFPVDDSGSSGSDQVPKDVTDSLDAGLDDGSLPVDAEISLDHPSVFTAEDAVPQIRYFSLGGPEVQRTVVSSSEPAAATPALTPAPSATIALPSSIATNNMPVRQTSSASLFNSSRDKAAIGVALKSPSSSESIGSSIGTKSSSTPKRSISQLQSISHNSDETSGLESLSPLIGDDADSPEVDSAPSWQEMQTDDQVTTEPDVVSSNEIVESSTNVVVQSSRPSSIIRPRMIDEVMSQYAENSYNA